MNKKEHDNFLAIKAMNAAVSVLYTNKLISKKEKDTMAKVLLKLVDRCEQKFS